MYKKVTFFSKNTKKDNIMTEEGEKHYRNTNVCRFSEKAIISDNIRNHCHLTIIYRGPACQKRYINVKQRQSNFIAFVFYYFSFIDCHIFFKTFVGKNIDKIKFDNLPKINKDFILLTYGCIRFIDGFRFQSADSESLFKTHNDFN